MDLVIAPAEDPAERRQTVESLTRRLPQWLAQPESNRYYAEQAEKREAWMARLGGEPCGLLLLKRHAPASDAGLVEPARDPLAWHLELLA